MDLLVRDIQQETRRLAASPGFVLLAVLVLGIGIGANSAIFSVVNAVLLLPLPYPSPQELVMVWGRRASK